MKRRTRKILNLHMRTRLQGTDREQWTQETIKRTATIINNDKIIINRTAYHITTDEDYAYLNWKGRQTYRMEVAFWEAIKPVTEVTTP